jgi:hypothetical protein
MVWQTLRFCIYVVVEPHAMCHTLSVTSLTLRATSAQGMDIRKAASCQRLSHPIGRAKITILRKF